VRPGAQKRQSVQGGAVAQNRKGSQRIAHLVFVYGTLKKGFPNHFFLKRATFVGAARTVDSYALYLDEYPGVYPDDAVCPVSGEVYAVDEAMLERLDALEDHPVLYRREQIGVLLDSGETVRAWIYFYPHKSGCLIASGEFDP
jgi:gamma-glutamylcyclotransferase (GGCT)/AIG2-like uncharacterized protein YtfP